MPNREAEALKRFHIYLYEDDLEWIRSVYGHRMSIAKAIRAIIRGVRKKVEARVDQEEDKEPLTLADLKLEEPQ